MQFPLSWLKSFVSFSGSPEELSELLTVSGLEVDRMVPTPLSFQGVVTALVVETERHPNADQLTLATVTDGKETLQIVCGAPNCRAGIKVALAHIGAQLDNGAFKIKKSKIRGVESFGMLCSEQELGFSTTSNGILELPAETPLGVDLTTLYGDLLLEISLTPNLGHCNSVYGIARELSALCQQPATLPPLKDPEKTETFSVQVEVKAPQLCPRYACLSVKGVKVAHSPEPLRHLIEACGMRSINNVVDATNITMLELGQPLHAFDLKKLQGSIVVQELKEEQLIKTLDGEERRIPKDTLCICDQRGPVAIAGVIGSWETQVDEETVDLLLESAHFTPMAVRQASRACLVKTESSKRFERGVDPNGVIQALHRCASRITELCGGALGELVEVGEKNFPSPIVAGRLSHTNRLLGTSFTQSEAESLLRRLAFDVTFDDADRFHCTIPTYRFDVRKEVDLIEEMGRLFGFQNLPKSTPRYPQSTLPHSRDYLLEQELRRRLIGEGLEELVTGNLVSEKMLTSFPNPLLPPATWVKVLNPSSIEHAVMRTSLLPSLLQVVAKNSCHGETSLASFEIGRIHFRLDEQYHEQPMCALLLTEVAGDFFSLKGMVENLLEGLNLPKARFERSQFESFHPGRQAKIIVEGVEVGVLGEVHPSTLRLFDVEIATFVATLSLMDLKLKRQNEPKMRPLPLFPASQRDWTITLDEQIAYGAILDAIEKTRSRLLQKVSLLDIYRSAAIGEGKKNVTLRFLYRDARKTLSVEAVEAEHARIVRGVQQTLGEMNS
ncbi:MAG: phenylalanine--tRNA ligase subunit beta [Verrucomicrobia bacterium]|nr:phenylalanine--tRNA ligase subunit beta [Verrucomicrobiota bacterium]